MLRSPLRSPTVRALGVTLTTFAALGGVTMLVTTGATTAVRYGLKRHRVRLEVWQAALTCRLVLCQYAHACREDMRLPAQFASGKVPEDVKFAEVHRCTHSFVLHFEDTQIAF